MITANRQQHRHEATLRRQGYTEDEIQKAPDHQAGDPLFDARGTRRYVGNISEMTLWRWSQEFDFPAPDVVIGRRRFWRRSTLDNWIESRRHAA